MFFNLSDNWDSWENNKKKMYFLKLKSMYQESILIRPASRNTDYIGRKVDFPSPGVLSFGVCVNYFQHSMDDNKPTMAAKYRSLVGHISKFKALRCTFCTLYGNENRNEH